MFYWLLWYIFGGFFFLQSLNLINTVNASIYKGGGGVSILIFFHNIEDDWSGLQKVFKVLLHRKIREVLSVYSIHTCTLSLSKGVDIAIFNLVNWKSDTLFTMLCNSLIRLIVIFRLFNTNEIYIIKSITFMNKQNNFHNDLSSFFFMCF